MTSKIKQTFINALFVLLCTGMTCAISLGLHILEGDTSPFHSLYWLAPIAVVLFGLMAWVHQTMH